MIRFKDRIEAGKLLAEKLSNYSNRSDVVILALPRGGVPVAFEIAKALNALLDVFLVRKLGVPGQEELAMGAIATGGEIVLNNDIVKLLCIPDKTISFVVSEEQKELDWRENFYRGTQPLPEIKDKVVILVDDGIATGSTMLVAIKAIKQYKPARIIVAVPVAPPSVCEQFRAEVDEFVCLITPELFSAVGLWYLAFPQVTHDDVRNFLEKAKHKELSLEKSK